jgi:hypothetical protein
MPQEAGIQIVVACLHGAIALINSAQKTGRALSAEVLGGNHR